MHQMPDSFLLAYVSRHTPGELLRDLSEKDVLVLRHVLIDSSNKMPHYRYRALMATWQAQAKTDKNKTTHPPCLPRLGTQS
jgi:hypothetical protein